MFDSLKIPVLGLVENMSYFICDGCDKKHFIFDEGGGRRMAEKYNLDMLAEFPLDPALRASGDQGMPITEESPESDSALRFMELARKVAEKIAAIQHAGPPPAPESENPQSKPGRRSLPIVN
jgi:ATP-binding protein involved in chromosome partitioning